jgi:hypothetical protein
LQPQAAAVLRWRLATQPRLHMLRIDCLLQPGQLPTQVTRPTEVLLAVAHGGHSSRRKDAEKTQGAASADTADREQNDQLSVRCHNN